MKRKKPAKPFLKRIRNVGPTIDLGGVKIGPVPENPSQTNAPEFKRIRNVVRKAAASPTSYTITQLAAMCGFPKLAGAVPQCIAIGELGGGYNLADLQAKLAHLGLPMCNITDVSVRGATNSPDGNPNGPDGEVMLDILVAAACWSFSTGVPADILMVWAPNDAKGIPDAIHAAIQHPKKPCVFSWSWGGPESSFGLASFSDTESALEAANAAGMTVTAASGDNLSSDGTSGAAVDYPAASASVVGVGGVSIPSSDPTRATVWNNNGQAGTGGGMSVLSRVPAYQKGVVPASFTGRGVPDVAFDADPETGYQIVVDGRNLVEGGTSAGAPMMAALVAVLCAATNQRFGNLNPILYAHPEAFVDVVSGDNGAYVAGPGWDATTGLGIPVGTKLLAAIQAANPVNPPVKPPVSPPTPPAAPAPIFSFKVVRATRAGRLDLSNVPALATGTYVVSKAA